MNNSNNCSGRRKAWAGPEIPLLKKWMFLIIPAVLVSCGEASYERYKAEQSAVADSVRSYVEGIATDTINGISHNFVRTADVKFKVKNVIQSTTQIERMVRASGGFITKSQVHSDKDYTNNVRFKKDSLVEQTFFTSKGQLTLRVPAKQLDSVLTEITALALFVDHRHLGADDVKLKLYSNMLAENRYSDYKERVTKKTDKTNAKLNQVTNAEETALQKQGMADNTRMESYELVDKVNYSTITLELYQDQQVMTHVTPRPYSIETYKPSFAEKLGLSLQNGFELLKELILFFANIWSVVLILGALFFGLKKLYDRHNKRPVALPQQ